jgi:hypothetical protein
MYVGTHRTRGGPLPSRAIRAIMTNLMWYVPAHQLAIAIRLRSITEEFSCSRSVTYLSWAAC